MLILDPWEVQEIGRDALGKGGQSRDNQEWHPQDTPDAEQHKPRYTTLIQLIKLI